ncbi:MAG: branched-chain-amino-acid transaminase [bacterium]
MSDQALCWINGKVIAPSEAKVSVFDHGFLYGDGVFEGLRFYGGKVFRLPRHLERLRRSAIALNLTVPMDDARLTGAVQALIDASPLDSGYLRLIVTRGTGELGIDPATCEEGSLIIIADELKMVPDEEREKGIKVVISSTRRQPPDRIDSRIKSLNYLTSILARMEANLAGASEAIMLNDRGFVAEGSADNVFIASGGELLTPPLNDGALGGITRATVLELADQLGIVAKEVSLTAYDLYNADECFLTGTGARLIPVREIDGRSLKQCPGTMYAALSTAFASLIEDEVGVSPA